MSRLDEIRERWEKATPGPWSWRPGFAPGHTESDLVHIVDPRIHPHNVLKTTEDWPPTPDDAEAIASAPTDMAWLLAEVKEARDDAAHFEAEYGDAVAEIARRDKVLDQVRVAFRACFAPDFGGWDWRDDDAVQTLARSLSRALSSLNTSSAQGTP